MGHLHVWEGKYLYRLAGDDGGWGKTAENIAKQWKTVGHSGGPQEYGTWWRMVGDNTMSSIPVIGSGLSGKFRK